MKVWRRRRSTFNVRAPFAFRGEGQASAGTVACRVTRGVGRAWAPPPPPQHAKRANKPPPARPSDPPSQLRARPEGHPSISKGLMRARKLADPDRQQGALAPPLFSARHGAETDAGPSALA